MSQSIDLQVDFDLLPDGTFKVVFKGESRAQEILLFKDAIDGRLKNAGTKIKKAIFDLTGIDPVKNAAGRMLDLACFYHSQIGIPIEVRFSAEIYRVLSEITPKEMPKPRKGRAKVRGVTVVVMAESTTPSLIPRWEERYAPPEEPSTLMACIGKVRAVHGQIVTVSLFHEGEEIIGEFNLSQFQDGQAVAGMVFDYEAVTHAKEGRTEIFLNRRTEQHAVFWDIADDLKALKKEYSINFDKI